MPTHLIAIDQGTTSTRAIVFDATLAPVAVAQQELRQIYPAPGWVEHDPEEIWSTSVATVRDAMAKAGVGAKDIAGIGITNQRETTIVWDRATGKPIHNAIVWQDRRTADACAALRARRPRELRSADKTGLLLDPYFSATKIAWLLDHVNGARAAAEAGRLAFGTVDSFPALAAHRRQGARHRRHQCGAHAAVRYRAAAQWDAGTAAACSAFRRRCCRRCATAPPISATTLPRSVRRRRSASSASPATSRRRPSGRAASRPA